MMVEDLAAARADYAKLLEAHWRNGSDVALTMGARGDRGETLVIEWPELVNPEGLGNSFELFAMPDGSIGFTVACFTRIIVNTNAGAWSWDAVQQPLDPDQRGRSCS